MSDSPMGIVFSDLPLSLMENMHPAGPLYPCCYNSFFEMSTDYWCC